MLLVKLYASLHNLLINLYFKQLVVKQKFGAATRETLRQFFTWSSDSWVDLIVLPQVGNRRDELRLDLAILPSCCSSSSLCLLQMP